MERLPGLNVANFLEKRQLLIAINCIAALVRTNIILLFASLKLPGLAFAHPSRTLRII